jgi:FAD synthetase
MSVMVFGTFDNIHPGHISYFSQARAFGEELIVIVARDSNVARIKGRLPRQGEQARVRAVRAALRQLDYRGRAVLGNKKNMWLVLKRYRPDFICLGYDQETDLSRLKSEIAGFRLFCKVKRLKAYQPEKYKSSYFRSI